MYTLYHYAFFFFAYSFLGWIGEEIYAFFKYRRFVNRGFINGPLCLQYGVAMVIITADVTDLVLYPVFQAVMCIALMAVMQGISGLLLHRITGRRFWDFSKDKLNLNGYTSITAACFYGIMAVLAVWVVNPALFIIFSLIPHKVVHVVLVVSYVVLFIDLFVTLAAAVHWKIEGNIYCNVAKKLEDTKLKMGNGLFSIITRRMCKAFPELENEDETQRTTALKERVFAKGISIEKLIWIFMVCALLGDIIETIFVFVVDGILMSRSSVIYGPFSIVWGLGGVFITFFLCPVRKWGGFAVFMAGTFLGGVYEYSCSVFTELVFGTVFWDYSHLPFNINGRINLLYCFFWGFAAIAWVYLVYPFVSGVIEKIPPVLGTIATIIVVIIMTLNAGVSALAVTRYVERNNETPPDNAIEVFLDNMYTDELIDKIYPNMIVK